MITEKSLLILLVVLLIRLASASNRTEPCPAEGEFRCRSSGRCIPVLWLCDGARDCAEGEDESEWRCHRHNHTRCAGDQPECGMPDGTFRCILHQWLCDGHDDCEDGSDERGCETKPPDLPSSGHLLSSPPSPKCSPSEFRCSTGSCISRDLVCDDVPHCPDASDESEDRCAMPPRMGVPEPAHEYVDEGNGTNNASDSTWLNIPENPFDLPEMELNGTGDGFKKQDDVKDPFVVENESKNVNESSFAVPNTIQNTSDRVQNAAERAETTGAIQEATNPMMSGIDNPLTPAESAFQPQIEDFDLFAKPANPTLIPGIPETSQVPQIPSGDGNKVIEDGNQAPPPDPFPFDLANYEIPEAEEEPAEGHDEMGGTGMVTTRAPPHLVGAVDDTRDTRPSNENGGTSGTGAGGEGNVGGSKEKAIEQLQLANVLQFMSNETKKILASINATKGHAVHSYKTVRNKSEVHSLSSYHHLPGLYTKLLPYDENVKNETSAMAVKGRARRQSVRIRAIPYMFRPIDLKSKRDVDERNDTKDKTNDKTNEETAQTEATLPPIVPLQLRPLAGQPISPIVPANIEEIEAKKKVEEPDEPQDAKKSEDTTSTPRSTLSTRRSTQRTQRPEIGANEDPTGSVAKSLPSTARRGSEKPARAQAMLTRSERLISEGGKERIVKDERPRMKKGLPRRIERNKYRDDGEGTLE